MFFFSIWVFFQMKFTVHRTVREGGGFTNTNVSAGWLLHSAYLCTWLVAGLEPGHLWFLSAIIIIIIISLFNVDANH